MSDIQTDKSPSFTPAPWHLSRDGITVFAGQEDVGVLIRGVEQRIPHIAYIARNGFGATFDEQQANARLIAAAPALYDALKLWVETARFLTPGSIEYDMAWQQATAALKAAQEEK